MLVLRRKRDESIRIGEDIVVTVADVRGGKVRLAIAAPRHIPIYRSEIAECIKTRELITHQNAQHDQS